MTMEQGQNRKKEAFFGLAIGLINGFFGSGGGIAAVYFLKKLGFEGKTAHANSLLLILPLSVIAAGIYFFGGNAMPGHELLFLVLGALPGAYFGGKLLGKIKNSALEFLFSLLILASGVFMLLS